MTEINEDLKRSLSLKDFDGFQFTYDILLRSLPLVFLALAECICDRI